jgi:nucleoside-diphosphate-sugar epimerase
MRVFITGASGHIGSALVPELLAHGHTILALARSDSSARALAAAGVEVRRGDLDDLDGIRRAAASADGVIHLAFKHDLAFEGDFAGAAASDLRVVEAIGAALEGSGKPFVSTSGTLTLGVKGRSHAPGTEEDVRDGGPRVDSENAVVALRARNIRSSVVRLAPVVHSSLDLKGFVPALIAMARKNGASAYVGDGTNRWPSVHTRDAARLYRLALEVAPPGSRLHGAAEEGIPFRAIAEVIGRGLGLPAISVSEERAAEHVGFLAHFAQLDNPTSSERTRALVGWEPEHPGLLADLAERFYFEA